MLATATKPISFKRPLLSLWTILSVSALKSEDDVLAAIEDGSLLWAFDLKTKRAKARLVRVLAASVCDFVAGNPPPKMTEADEWRQVLNLIFGSPAPPSIPAKDLALAWNVSGSHVLNLCDQKLLRLVKGTPRHCGLGGSPQILFESAVGFLRERRIF